MVTPAVQVGMSLDDFIRQYGRQPFELTNAANIPLMPQVAGHGQIVQILGIALDQYAVVRQLGEAWMRMPFVQVDNLSKVIYSLTPDVIYFNAKRIAHYKVEYPDWKQKPYILVPDLVVEVVSPNGDDELGELDEKVNLYLTDGVRLVWVINPNKEQVAIYTLVALQPFTKQQTTLKVGDTLSGGELIPGFEIAVASLFE
jgi:Uma2 family endonuclease